jgi:hypothetical protein
VTMRNRRSMVVLIGGLCLALLGCSPLVPIARGYDGEPADGPGYPATVSDDGTVISFTSHATNLVPGDTNGVRDVFVLDRRTDETTRVSVRSDGTQASDESLTYARVSGDGNVVVFVSRAPNLVPGDDNGVEDVFVHDLRTGTTELVSVGSDGRQATGVLFGERPRGAAISDDGRLVAFSATGLDATTDEPRPYLHDRRTGRTTPVPGPALPAGATIGALSGDGRTLAYLVTDIEDWYAPVSVVVRDLRTGEDDRILAGHLLISNYSIDIDDRGRTVVWGGRDADWHFETVVADRRHRTVEVIAATDGFGSATSALSSNGRFVTTFTTPPDDTTGSAAIAVLDRRRGTTTPVGIGYWSDVSDDGRVVTVETFAQEGPFLWLAPGR